MTRLSKFSFIIPAHNEEEVIEKCLNSVLKQKGDFEIVVVNDGSTDRTREITEKLMKKSEKIKLINFSKGHSAAFARNRGAEKAKGEWLIFIDADMTVENHFLKKVEIFLKRNPEIDGSDYLVYSHNPKTIFQKAWSAYRKCYPSIGIPHIIKNSVFKKLGGYNENIFYYEDTEFMERFNKKCKLLAGNAKAYHIEPETWKDFVRQRKWQGRQAPLKYFLPCFFPPLILIQFFKIWKKSKEFKNSFYWMCLDLIGRYVSLWQRTTKLFQQQ